MKGEESSDVAVVKKQTVLFERNDEQSSKQTNDDKGLGMRGC